MKVTNMKRALLQFSGALILAMTISAVPQYIAEYLSGGGGWFGKFLLVVIVPQLAPLVVGLTFLKFPSMFVRGDDNESGEQMEIQVAALAQVAIFVLGVFLVARGISDTVFSVSFGMGATDAMLESEHLAARSSLFAVVTEIVSGIAICRFSRNISRLVR